MFDEKLLKAFAADSIPCNPIPFANGLAELVKERGTNAITSDDAKKLLWVLMAQAYGQCAEGNLSEEWHRLYALEQKS